MSSASPLGVTCATGTPTSGDAITINWSSRSVPSSMRVASMRSGACLTSYNVAISWGLSTLFPLEEVPAQEHKYAITMPTAGTGNSGTQHRERTLSPTDRYCAGLRCHPTVRVAPDLLRSVHPGKRAIHGLPRNTACIARSSHVAALRDNCPPGIVRPSLSPPTCVSERASTARVHRQVHPNQIAGTHSPAIGRKGKSASVTGRTSQGGNEFMFSNAN